MADLNAFVSDFLRQRGLGEQARPKIMAEIEARLTDMILDNLDSESALDEYAFLRDSNEQIELKAFLESAIPDLDEREQQILAEFSRDYTT